MAYAELHARTSFSFLDGASQPKEVVSRARELGYQGLAVTDVNGLYGIVETRDALLDLCGLHGRDQEPQLSPRLLYGSEIQFDDDVAVAIAQTREGYANLSTTLAEGRLAVEKGQFRLNADQLCERPGELVLLAGGPRSAIMRHLVEGEVLVAESRLALLREAFGERLHVELVRHLLPGDRERSLAMAALARRLRLPIVATNDVHFHAPARKRLHDVLRCIRLGVPLREAGRRLLPNAEAHLKSPEQMAALFSDLPEAIERTGEIVRQVSFRLRDIHYSPPAPGLPEGVDADTHLAQLCRAGLRERLGGLADNYWPQLEHEFRIIRELGYAGYFLVMHEIVIVCGRKGILCQGRGSAANSLVCFALGITSVRPDVIHMLFERFLSKERAEPPDIDLDIEHDRREEILQHVYEKYGRRRAAMVAEIIRFRERSALREVGQILGFSPAQLTRLSRMQSYREKTPDLAMLNAAGIAPDNPALQLLLDSMQTLKGFPRHLSIHVGGFVIADEPIARSVPIENGRMADRTVMQWAKDDVDSMGMFKLDLLGLGMLTVLSKAFALVQARGVTLALQTVPEDDPATYEMLRRADSVGVFQVESRAQMNMLPRLRPVRFYDLVIQVAIVRPGPIQGDMVHPYLRRRSGKEEVRYDHPALKPILERTLGVPLFQEQVMRLAEAVGSYTPGEADQLRRDMASWKSAGRMEQHRERLLSGMAKNGLAPEFAERVFKQILGFGSYGFPESHAAAWAYLAYVSAYLKCHHPVEFACALLNAQPMGFYSPAVIVNDARQHGIEIRPIDVQRSQWDSTVEDGALRLGFRLVRGLPQAVGEALAQARATGAFTSVEDLKHRGQLTRAQAVALAAAGALASLHDDRRTAIWAVSAHDLGPLFAGVTAQEPAPKLPKLRPMDELHLDIEWGSAFPGQHPLALLRPALDARGILRAAELKTVDLTTDEARRKGLWCRVAGLVITRQMPGTKGILFVTLEDETGHADIAVMPDLYARFREVLRRSSALVILGRLTGMDGARSLQAGYITPLSLDPLALDRMPAGPSHDFR
jgi:error-prone DNA polymerase